jgi:thiamine-phosphate pyrophosphorylase
MESLLPATTSSSTVTFHLPHIYPIVDTSSLVERSITPLDAASALIDGGARILQFRHKLPFTRRVFEEAERIAVLCARNQVIFVMNDRADLARLLQAALHLGQDDLPPAIARRVLGDQLPLGYSTHNLRQLREASGEPVDYLAIGPIFGTVSKQNPDPMVGLEVLREVGAACPAPLVAIGGITIENAQRLYDVGVRSVSLIADLYALGNSAEAMRRRMRQWHDLYPPLAEPEALRT